MIRRLLRLVLLEPKHVVECVANLAPWDAAEMTLDHRPPGLVIREAAAQGLDSTAALTPDADEVVAVGGVHIYSQVANLAALWLWTTTLARRRPRAFLEAAAAFIRVWEREGWRLLLMAPEGHPYTSKMIEALGFTFANDEQSSFGILRMRQRYAYRQAA